MSRYIDADALIAMYKGDILTAQTDYAEGVRDVIKDIKGAPTIDMGDLISRNDVINAISENYGGEHFTDAIIDLIDSAPSIDIVRCQDCKYWVCNFNGCRRNPCTEPWYATDGCTYGEREGE